MKRTTSKKRPAPKPCCDRMAADLNQTCDQHPNRFDCADMLIHRTKTGAYGLIVHDGGGSYIQIEYCPWCGAKLPSHSRGRWQVEDQ